MVLCGFCRGEFYLVAKAREEEGGCRSVCFALRLLGNFIARVHVCLYVHLLVLHAHKR